MDANSTKLAAIVADTNELQTNQGGWLTATGFSTHSAADVVTAIGTGSTLTALATASNLAAAKSVIDEILTDTGTTLPAQISGISGGGGGGYVNVLPATGIVANRTPGATLTPVVGETISQSITLYSTDGTTPIDLSGKTLTIVFETLSGTDVATVASGNITISGASSNVVTFAYPSAVTASERTLRFAIRDEAAPLTMYLQGLCSVVRAPQVDP
jgi:hypothetical protein